MYVEKFSGETLDEALQQVKRKLGPDAIILKTVSNKGIKGALKKARIEITAAISEQQYVEKAEVDQVLSDQQKEKFYSENPSQIADSIRNYHGKNREQAPTPGAGGYGNLGLNRVVNTINKTANKTKDKIKHGLDEFLGAGAEEVENEVVTTREQESFIPVAPPETEIVPPEEVNVPTRPNTAPGNENFFAEFEKYRVQLESLERNYQTLLHKFDSSQGRTEDESQDFNELILTLRGAGISDPIINYVIKKANFELDEKQRKDENVIIDFLLRVLSEIINIKMPEFANLSNKTQQGQITVLVSDFSCGQSSSAVKICSNLEKCKLISFKSDSEIQKYETALKMFNVDYTNVSELANLFLEIRKSCEKYENVVIDFKAGHIENAEFKRFYDGLKRSFDDFEIFLNISAIHSEAYNRKTANKYQSFVDGVIINQLDLCMEFGSLINIHYATKRIPFVYFGTGPSIPDDFELASKERILSGMFNL